MVLVVVLVVLAVVLEQVEAVAKPLLWCKDNLILTVLVLTVLVLAVLVLDILVLTGSVLTVLVHCIFLIEQNCKLFPTVNAEVV